MNKSEIFFNKLQDNTINMVDRNTYLLEFFIELVNNKNLTLIKDIINSEKLYELHPSLLMGMKWMLKPSFFKTAFSSFEEIEMSTVYLDAAYETVSRNYDTP